MNFKTIFSLPKEEKLHGLKIRKFAVGDYQGFVNDLLTALPEVFGGIQNFKDASSDEIIGVLMKLDASTVTGLLAGNFNGLFERLVFLCSRWFAVPEEDILAMDPVDLRECIERLWEVNRLGKLLPQKVRQVLSGFKNLSPFAQDSESPSGN